MWKYSLRRILQIIPILLGVATVTSILIYVIPVDPARLQLGARADLATVEDLRQEMGLDDPIHIRYGRFLWRAFHGDLGRSFYTNEKVVKSILKRFPATALLALTALVISIWLGILIGVIAAIKRQTLWDSSSMVVALIGVSLPSFFLGLILQWLLGLKWPLFPVSGYVGGTEGQLFCLVLPMLTLATRPLAIFARLTRSSMLEVMRQDYITTARAKGLGEIAVIFQHSLRNALIPVTTAISGSLAALLSGAFFIEYIFNWPGIGGQTEYKLQFISANPG